MGLGFAQKLVSGATKLSRDLDKVRRTVVNSHARKGVDSEGESSRAPKVRHLLLLTVGPSDLLHLHPLPSTPSRAWLFTPGRA
jgi:hypothetical protein